MTVRRLLISRFDLHLDGLRWLGGAMLALGALLPLLPGDPGVPCPLRSTTGVPCPGCGLTRSVKAVMRFDLADAWFYNPFGIAAVATAVVLLARPRLKTIRFPLALMVVAIAVSWSYQLYRYGFLT